MLLVSAIESVAQKAIKRKHVKELSPKEEEWKKMAKNNNEFKEVFDAYKDMRGKNEYLSKRFTKFILEFCPPDEWENIVFDKYSHPNDKRNFFGKGIRNPALMEVKEIEGILKEAYEYRSRFVHDGAQPPHSSPEPTISKFFEVVPRYKNGLFQKEISPSYGLMLGIAKHSIMKWLKTKI